MDLWRRAADLRRLHAGNRGGGAAAIRNGYKFEKLLEQSEQPLQKS